MFRKLVICALLPIVCLATMSAAPLKRVCKGGVCQTVSQAQEATTPEPNTPIYRLDKIGVFFGLHGGFGVGSLNDNKPNSIPQNSIEPYIGVRLGYNYYILNYLGIRIYGTYDIDVHYFLSKNSNAPSAHRFLFNADLMYDMYSTSKTILGIFAGLGIGYGFQDNDSNKIYSALLLPIKLGISFTLNKKHKVDLFSRIPTFSNTVYYGINTVPKNTKIEEADFKSTMLGIGYSYIF